MDYPHWGETYDYSDLPKGTGPRDDPDRPATLPSHHLETRAVVALLTRSILIASEGAAPVEGGREKNHYPIAEGYYGGHVLMRQGFATFQVQGVEFQNLGQGGNIGTYPVHFHMDRTVPAALDRFILRGYIPGGQLHPRLQYSLCDNTRHSRPARRP